MRNVVGIGGYTGSVTIVDQDGQGWDAWCQAGEVTLGEDSSFMVVPSPMPDHYWAQVRSSKNTSEET